MARLDAIDKKTLGKIEKLAETVLKATKGGKNPAVEIRIRSLSNVSFNERKRIIELGDKTQSREFFNTAMAQKFMQTFLVAEGCKTLIDEGKTISIRQMFYMTKHTLAGTKENTFEDQNESDPIIEDLEVGIDALREELHLFATGAAAMVGPMVICDAGDKIDLRAWARAAGRSRASARRTSSSSRKSEAEFILLVEKEAVWQRFNEDKFWQKHKCILMTGQGQADARRAPPAAAHATAS